MILIDLIGFAGVLMILIAYFLNLRNKLQTNDLRYILLNFIGASLACLASVMMEYLPFILLEGTWAIVSLIALIQYLRKGPNTVSP
jgi:hypothetical protein